MFIFTGYSFDFGQSYCTELSEVLRALGLEDRWHNKITLSEVAEHTVNAEKKEKISASTCAFTLLRQLLLCNSDAMATVVYENPEHNVNRTFKCRCVKRPTETTSQLSPLDILTAVFQCCDPMLKELLVKKMFLCKMAIPFVFLRGISDLFIDDWPLESLCINENLSALDSGRLIKTKTYIVTFVRMCRPKISKSQVLNELMSKNNSCVKPIFFDITCKGGALPKKLGQKLIEVFWVPKVNKEETSSSETPITFLNVRGQLTDQTLDVVERLSDCAVIVTDLEALKDNLTENAVTINKFRRPVLFVCGNSADVSEDVSTALSDIPVIFTIEGNEILDMAKRTSALESEIEKQLPNEMFSLQQRLARFGGECNTSSSHRDLVESWNEARAIFDRMCENNNKSGISKEIQTPASRLYSTQLGELVAEMAKLCDIKTKATKHSQLKSVRRLQVQACTPAIRFFLYTLVKNSKLSKYIVRCLRLLIEDYNKELLSNLENRKVNNLKQLKSKTRSAAQKVELNKCIEKIKNEIENLSLSTHHLFREIAHIYDSVIELQCDVDLPKVEDAASVLADLIISGYPIEVFDGENWYMPINWVQCVFNALSVKLNQPKLAVISVLGIQSSGKSTLMNIMFGMDLQTRSGRCTRGIEMRLVPVSNEQDNKSMNFTHLLLIDTEGLRAPDIGNELKLKNRDNQLATFVTGLGDVTLINNMGENFAEMRDILEIIVHAFLRLKLARKTLKEGQTCMFLHHNVTDKWAKYKMRDGFVELLEMLNTAAYECGKAEGSEDITEFNDIIRFDIDSNTFTIPHLWQGNYPLKFVNASYFERVNAIRNLILQYVCNSENGYSATNFRDFSKIAAALWSGVLSEDFIFSFKKKNLELKLYYILEEDVDKLKWDFELYCKNELRIEVIECLGRCSDVASLDQTENETKFRMSILIQKKQSALQRQFENIFETSKYKEIISQWKPRQCLELAEMAKTLQSELHDEITKLKKRRLLKIKVSELSEDDRRAVRAKTIDIARTLLDNRSTSYSKYSKIFDTEIWDEFKSKVMKTCKDDVLLDFRQCFTKELSNSLNKHTPILQQQLTEADWSHLPSDIHTSQGAADNLKLSSIPVHKDFLKKTCTSDLDEAAQPYIKTFRLEIENLAKSFLIPDTELSHRDVRCFFKELNIKYQKLKSVLQKKSISVNSAYKVMCFLHVSHFARSLFENHNRQYKRKHGVESQLYTFKLILKTEFNLVLNGRKEEERVAICFSKAFLQLVLERAAEKVPALLLFDLKHRMPTSKTELLQNIYLYLMELDDFGEYVSFFCEPKLFATNMLCKLAEGVLREDLYKDSVVSMITKMLRCIEKVINQSDVMHGNEVVSEKEWYTSLKKNDPEGLLDDAYFNYVSESTYIAEMAFFKDCLLKTLKDTVDQFITESSCLWKEDIVGKNVLSMFEKVVVNFLWGCDELCPFCKEPCSKSQHVGGSHVCIQHRPSCCRGMRNEKSEACLEVCDYDVQSNSVYNCGAIDFKCSCKTGANTKHKYKKYKDLFPEWDIDVSSNMYGRTVFWIWFIARHQTQLADHFKYRIHVPDEWYNVTENDAKASLKFYVER